MKIIQMNALGDGGSTGRICLSISRHLTEHGIENAVLYSLKNSEEVNCKKVSTDAYIKRQAIRSHLLGNYGFNSVSATKRIIAELEKSRPDILHIHNIHGHDCHLERLFDYLGSSGIKVLWTFHDCWAFTGYCTHFVLSGCDKWKTGCNACADYRHYSLLFDRSKELYEKKKRLLSNADFTIVTPSKWLKSRVEQSFLKDHYIEVIPNGVDTSVFKPTVSDFREKYHISDKKKIILSAAFHWGYAKGLDVFVALAKQLDPDRYEIVLVGTDENVEAQLPDSVTAVRRTKDAYEMAKLYSAADVFVNPTRADTFPTVNMEALACGLPVITFNTGGSPEMLTDDTGIIVEKDDLPALKQAIAAICEDGAIDRTQCMKRAEELTVERQCERYEELYRKIAVE